MDLSANTQRAYRGTFEKLIEDVGHRSLASIGRATIERHLRERYAERAPATVNRHLAAISAMFAWAAEIGIIDSSPAASIRRRRQTRSSQAERQARPIPIEELRPVSDRQGDDGVTAAPTIPPMILAPTLAPTDAAGARPAATTNE